MRLMIDTNVVLDVLLGRKDFYDNSKAVLDLCENKKILGFVSASSITDIFYLVRRALRNTDETYKAESAKSNNCVGIVTRDEKDFRDFDIKLYSPEQIIAILK